VKTPVLYRHFVLTCVAKLEYDVHLKLLVVGVLVVALWCQRSSSGRGERWGGGVRHLMGGRGNVMHNVTMYRDQNKLMKGDG
jgi:hypothetical protein